MTATYTSLRSIINYGILSFVVFILYFGTFALANAAEWYVRPEGGSYGSENGSSYANAFDGFQAIDWANSVDAGDTVYVCGTHLRNSNSNAYLASQGVFSIEGGTEGNRTALDGSCPGGEQGIMWGAYKDTRNGGMLAANWEEVEDGVYYNETKTWHKAFVSNGLYENVDDDEFDKYTRLESAQEVIDSNEDGVYYIEAFGSNQHKVWLRPFNEATFAEEIRWTGAGAWGMWFGTGSSHTEVRNMRFHATTFGMSGKSGTDMLEDVTFKDTVIYPYQSGTVFRPFHAHDIVFDGIEIGFAGEGIYVVWLNNSTTNNVTIKNSYFHDIGAPWIDDYAGQPYTPDGHAIGVQNMDNYSITNNRFERVPSGINFHMGGSVSFTQKHIDIIGNYFDDLRGEWGRVAKGVAIVFDGHNDMPKGQSGDITIAHNIAIGCEGTGIMSTRKDVVNYYNNTIVGCGTSYSMIGNRYDGASVHAYNNISLEPKSRHFYYNQNGPEEFEFRADNNSYYPAPTNSGDFYFLVTNDGISTPGVNASAWPGWAEAHSARYPGTEANTIITDPFPGKTSFLTATDLTPELGSPLIDSGEDVGQTKDFFGNPIYGTPDRGAIEYQPPYTLGSDYIYENHSVRVYADGNYRYLETPTPTKEIADFVVAPQGGNVSDDYSHYADFHINTWNNGGDKTWTFEEGGSISGAVTFTIGDLNGGASYELVVDGTNTGIIAAAGSNGRASLTYNGGAWSAARTFSVNETSASPTPTPTPIGDLVAHWTFDKNDTTTSANDASGNNNTGFFSGFVAPTLVTGAMGDAIQLDGANDFINLNSVRTSLAGDTTTSIALWVKTSKAYTGSTFGSILGINTGTGGNTALLSVGHNGTGNAFDNQFSIYDGVSGSFEGDTNTIIADGTWHHLTYVRNGNTGTLYVDGIAKSTHAPNFSFSGTDTWSLGMDYDGTNVTDLFQGAIDDVRVYNKALSASEVAQLSDNGDDTPNPVPTPTPNGNAATYRFIKWTIEERRDNENSVQAAELELTLGGNKVAWPAGTTATNPQGYSPSDERSEHIIDGQTAKWLDFMFSANGPGSGSATEGKSDIVIDTGVGNRVTFDGYRWRTANDHVGRDPIRWSIFGSHDGIAWEQLDGFNSPSIPTARNTFTRIYTFDGEGNTDIPTPPGTGAVPIIEFAGTEENSYGGNDEVASIEIEVDITAYDGDIYIPKYMAYHDEVTKVGYIKYYVETGGEKLSMGELESVSGTIDTTAEEAGTEFYKINDGEVETFWFTIAIDPVKSGFYRAGLQSPLQYLTSTNGTVHTESFSEVNFRSNYIQINSGAGDIPVPEPEPEPTEAGDHRFIKWEVNERRGTANSIQAAEFELRQNGNTVAWPAGTTATNPGGRSPSTEKPEKAIDGGSGKWLDFDFADSNSSLEGNSVLVIDTGITGVSFDEYRIKTANDFSARDPLGWNLYVSDDGEDWELVDQRSDARVPTTRNTFTSEFDLGNTITPKIPTYQMVRWTVTGRRGTANSIQIAEFELLNENYEPVAWPAGTVATNPGGSNPSAEKPEKAIDGGNGKWLDLNFADSNGSTNGESVLLIDTGAGNSVTFIGYQIKTANDFADRDPVSWKLEGSNDGSNWTTLTNVTNAWVPTARYEYTDSMGLGNVLGASTDGDLLEGVYEILVGLEDVIDEIRLAI